MRYLLLYFSVFNMCFRCVLILVFFGFHPKLTNDHGSVAPSGDRDRRQLTQVIAFIISGLWVLFEAFLNRRICLNRFIMYLDNASPFSFYVNKNLAVN